MESALKKGLYEEVEAKVLEEGSLCTCAKCNTDIDCAEIAARCKTKSDYDREVRRVRKERNQRGLPFFKGRVFERYMEVFGTTDIPYLLFEHNIYVDFPHDFECHEIEWEYAATVDEYYLVFKDAFQRKFIKIWIDVRRFPTGVSENSMLQAIRAVVERWNKRRVNEPKKYELIKLSDIKPDLSKSKPSHAGYSAPDGDIANIPLMRGS